MSGRDFVFAMLLAGGVVVADYVESGGRFDPVLIMFAVIAVVASGLGLAAEDEVRRIERHREEDR